MIRGFTRIGQCKFVCCAWCCLLIVIGTRSMQENQKFRNNVEDAVVVRTMKVGVEI